MSNVAAQDMGSQVVFTVAGAEVTRDQANRAFSAVQNPANWKLPVDITLNDQQVAEAGGIAVIVKAVEFYTGSKCIVAARPYRTTFTAIGYYAAVGA
jgi:hypothetical protein